MPSTIPMPCVFGTVVPFLIIPPCAKGHERVLSDPARQASRAMPRQQSWCVIGAALGRVAAARGAMMSRADLIQALAFQNPDLSASDVERIVQCFFDAITAHLAECGRIEIRGFGSFETRAREARMGRNPSNGEAVSVRAKRRPHFKPGSVLREQIKASAPDAKLTKQ